MTNRIIGSNYYLYNKIYFYCFFLIVIIVSIKQNRIKQNDLSEREKKFNEIFFVITCRSFIFSNIFVFKDAINEKFFPGNFRTKICSSTKRVDLNIKDQRKKF